MSRMAQNQAVRFENATKSPRISLMPVLTLILGLVVNSAVIRQAVAYLDEIASEQVGWHFDIGNMIKYSPPENWIRAIGRRILKLHMKEYSRTKGFGVGFFEGDNNWPEIMKALENPTFLSVMKNFKKKS